jgi:S1-C subfamily serine protease
MVSTLQRRGMRVTKQMGVFHQPAGETGGGPQIKEKGMILVARYLPVVMILVWFSQGFASADLSISQIAEKHALSVVTIVALGKGGKPVSSGTGFFLDRQGLIATSHHVLAGHSGAIIRTFNGDEGEIIEVTHDDSVLDLTIARTSLRASIPLILGDSNKVQVNDRVVMIGNAPGKHGLLSTGSVAGIRDAEDIQLLQITAPISPGCSGGPVLNLRGEVIGIATAFIASEKDLGFAMPVNYLKTLKPARMKLAELPSASPSFQAEMRGRTVTKILLIRDHERASYPAPIEKRLGHEETKAASPFSDAKPGTVYFKNGEKLLCDRAWKEDRIIFLVIHGKRYAVGYDETEIDMEKSFH